MRQPRRLHALKDFVLVARDGEVGRIEQVYFDDREWIVRYFVVRSGGRLLGRDLLISPRSVGALDEDNKRIELDLSREQVEAAPPISREQPPSRHDEVEYHRHYGFPPYWEASAVNEPLLTPPPQPFDESESPALRDSGEVIGYRLQARDGELGHVYDLVLDDQDWTVRYFVVDTRNWWPGKKVLIAPAWVDRVSWVDQAIFVGLGRERIQTAPPYHPDQIISHEDEVRLYAHYGKEMFAAGASLPGADASQR